MISGHEPCGLVAEIGPGVGHLAVGDRVCVYHSLGCGHCRHCLAGTPVFCNDEGAFGRTRDGCHADFMAAPAVCCLPLPDAFSFATGAMLACSAGTAFASLHKLPLQHGQTLAVFGLGPVGLTALLMGQAKGLRCIGVEVNAFRIALAKRLTEGIVIDASACDAAEAILDATNGEGAQGVMECSGSAAARTQTAAAAAWHGGIVIVGAGSDDLHLDPWAIISKELTVRGSSVYSMGEYFAAADFLQRHPLPLDAMVTHRFTIEQAPEAFETFSGGDTGKVVFEWA